MRARVKGHAYIHIHIFPEITVEIYARLEREARVVHSEDYITFSSSVELWMASCY